MVDYVIGGTGFLGSHLVRRLKELGHEVILGVRMSSSISKLIDVPVEIDIDLSELYRADVVYYCAGVLGKRGIPLSDYEEAHIRFPLVVMNKLTHSQVFHYVSSAYSLQPNELYEKTKLTGEKYVTQSGLNYIISRPAPIIGEGDMHHFPLYKAINKLGRLTPIIGSGNNRICWVYVKDYVDYMITPPSGVRIYNVASVPIAIKDFLERIAMRLGKSKPFIHVPYKQGSFKSISGIKFLTEERIYNGYHGKTSLDEALNKSITWYKANNYI